MRATWTTTQWYNADEVTPSTQDEQILYLTSNGKMGVFKSNRSWEFHKEKYSVKWWTYAKDAAPYGL